jgi:dipeptidase E
LKLLLTSYGITNNSIREALVDLLGKPISESNALFVPTAVYAYPYGSNHAWQFMKTNAELGWKEFGILELTTIPNLPDESWQPQIEKADTIIVGGGNGFYLSYWMQESGLFDILPTLLEQDKVYVGISVGSMIVSPTLHYKHDQYEKTGIYYDDEYDEEAPPKAGSIKTLKLVDFVIRPHVNANYFPAATLENVEKWARTSDWPLYALDDQSAIKIIDRKVKVISEGKWKLFNEFTRALA